MALRLNRHGQNNTDATQDHLRALVRLLAKNAAQEFVMSSSQTKPGEDELDVSTHHKTI